MIRWARRAALVVALIVGFLSVGSPEAGANPLAPSEPRNLRATSGETIELVWDAPELNGDSLAGYRVYRGEASGALALHATVTERRFSERVVSGEFHYYAVSAVGAGEGPRSPVVRAGSLVASAPHLVVAQHNQAGPLHRVQLGWRPPAYNGTSPITEYRVYSRGGKLLATARSEDRELILTTSYDEFAITAVNAHGEGRYGYASVRDWS